MEPTGKHVWGAEDIQYSETTAGKQEREVPEWEIKLGKIIFYITCALSIWFFYWLNGVPCPCE